MATIPLPVASGFKLETSGAQILESTASATIKQGQWLYASSANEVAPADASTAAKATVVGLAILDADTGNPAQYVAANDIVIEGFSSLTANTKYVLSGTSGQMELLSDLTASEYVTYLCTAQTSSSFKIRIEVTGLQA